MLMDVRQSVLPNGIKVVTAAMPNVQSVSAGLWVGVGGRHESKHESGISHFMEHMLFKGTKRRTAREISQTVEGSGGYLNAFTQAEATCYYARVAYEKLEEALDVLSDMYMNPLLKNSDVERERGVIVEEIMMCRDQPQQRVQEMLGEMLWVGHPLGRPVSGYPETVGKLWKADLLRFRRETYVAGNTLCTFAGRVDHEGCVDAVRKFLGRVRGGTARGCRVCGRGVRQETAKAVAQDTEQTHLAMGVRVFGRVDPRRYALKMLSIVLGENMSSRLFQKVREQHGLAYSVYSAVQLFAETGVLLVEAGLDKRKFARAFRLIAGEMSRLGRERVGRAEMDRARDYAVGQLRLSLENSANQMMWTGENILLRGRHIPPEEVIRRIEAVTAADLAEVARFCFRRGNMSVAAIGPGFGDRERAVIAAGLASF